MKRIILIIVSMLLLASCRSTRVPVGGTTEQSHDTIYVSKMCRDTIYHKDSVYMVMELRGDTIIKDRIQYKYIYKEHTRIDTTYIAKCDTITRNVVTNELTTWQKREIGIGRFSIGLLILAIICLIYKLYKKVTS